jgi:hypothetical protein
VPDGRVLKTLYDAGHYAAALPKAAQERSEWQTAAEMLILAAEGVEAGHVRRDCYAPGAGRPDSRGVSFKAYKTAQARGLSNVIDHIRETILSRFCGYRGRRLGRK